MIIIIWFESSSQGYIFQDKRDVFVKHEPLWQQQSPKHLF